MDLDIAVHPNITRYEEGDHINLTCTCHSNPRGTITWFKDGFFVVKNELLSLGAVREQDSGLYSCVAENDVHMLQASSKIVIDCK